jgi:hypothetical protein
MLQVTCTQKLNRTVEFHKRGISRMRSTLIVVFKGLGAIRVKIGPTSDVDKIFSKMYSQYVFFRNKYS